VGLGPACRCGRGRASPNFAGAELAAARLLEIEPWKSATAIKVNPDLPQRPLRAEALRRGILRLGQPPATSPGEHDPAQKN
jgi:5-formyltetrahydrofolate cyclo-ligase